MRSDVGTVNLSSDRLNLLKDDGSCHGSPAEHVSRDGHEQKL